MPNTQAAPESKHLPQSDFMPSGAPSALLAAERVLFQERYNRQAFAFSHSIHRLEVFNLPNLVQLSRRLAHSCYYSTADAAVGDGWSKVGERKLTLQDTLATIAETNSLVLLSHCDKDPEFGPIFHDIMSDVINHVGEALSTDVSIRRATLVVSSPRRLTSYHIDSEVNYLLQVRGEKRLHVFDPLDRSVLTEAELEAFYGGDFNGAKYKEERECDATVFALEPGTGVHMPLHAPHWAENGDRVSVGLSLNFNLHSGARLAALYKVNRRLRQAGLDPSPPGGSSWQDTCKIAAFKTAGLARSLSRRRALTP